VQPALFKGGDHPGDNDERKQEADQQPAETEIAQGEKKDQISQKKDKQAREAAFAGPQMPRMES
jgi:hypothetical protein